MKKEIKPSGQDENLGNVPRPPRKEDPNQPGRPEGQAKPKDGLINEIGFANDPTAMPAQESKE